MVGALHELERDRHCNNVDNWCARMRSCVCDRSVSGVRDQFQQGGGILSERLPNVRMECTYREYLAQLRGNPRGDMNLGVLPEMSETFVKFGIVCKSRCEN